MNALPESILSDHPADLGELERAVMLLVWRHAPIVAQNVRSRLPRPLKESTIRTVLRRLEQKGYVNHAIEGRKFVYRPAATRSHVAAQMVKRIIDEFCDGSIDELLAGLVGTKIVGQEHLSVLTELLKNVK